MNKQKTKKHTHTSRHIGRRDEFLSGFNQKSVLQFLLFIGYSFAVFFICFFKESPAGPQVVSGEMSHVRVVSELPFSYISKIRTNRLIDKRRYLVAPVYQLNMKPYEHFEDKILSFSKDLNVLEASITGKEQKVQTQAVSTFILSIEEKYDVVLNEEEVLTLLIYSDVVTRERVFEDGLSYLGEILSEGIIDSREVIQDDQGQLFYRIEIASKRNGEVRMQSEEEAHFSLRRYLKILKMDFRIFQTVFKILKSGLVVNLSYDAQKTDEKVKNVVSKIEPVVVKIEEGKSIIEPGSIITKEQQEQLKAYRKELRNAENYGYGFTQDSAARFFTTLAILLFSLIYMKLALVEEFLRKKRIFLSAFVLLMNLLLIRIILGLGNTALFVDSATLVAILPYLAPIMLCPVIITLLLGVRSALLGAFLVSFFNSAMQGNNINTFVLSLIGCGIVIYFVSFASLRIKVVKAAAIAGGVIAGGILFKGIFNEVDWLVLGEQMLVVVLVGTLTGLISVGLLPAFEKIFHYTSNITLFELTDFNHPLLRRLQMMAPGTYHHSLMVANLSERAASEIGANPLVCRACSLFHDIGKIEKPNYFTENQAEGTNPHDEKSPSVSALVIKSHVKDGVEIAKEAKLPEIIIDVIEQHHGTSLIQYFYSKALQKQKDAQDMLPLENSETDDSEVDESAYRYDGPKPNFKESAIVHFADSLEAAGRSLVKVSHQSVNEMVNAIIEDRIADHQLDDCPLTLQEISKLKESFSFTLFNMLHSRVKYPSLKDEMID